LGVVARIRIKHLAEYDFKSSRAPIAIGVQKP